MKKLLLAVSLFVNSFFLFYACTKVKPEENSPSNDGNKSGANSITRNNALSSNTPPINCPGPYSGLPYEEVLRMIHNYRDNQYAAIKSEMNLSDARACWFSLKNLKDFICHLESELQASNCNNLQNLGIRFYYGAHNSEPPLLAGVPDNYARLHNLILIPTYQNLTGFNIDFDPSLIDKGTCKPLPLSMAMNKPLRGILTAEPNSSGSGDIFAMDHGQLGPPDVTGMAFYP